MLLENLPLIRMEAGSEINLGLSGVDWESSRLRPVFFTFPVYCPYSGVLADPLEQILPAYPSLKL